MHVKDAIGTKNVTLWAIDVRKEAVMNDFNCIEQIYKWFQAPFGSN